MLEQGYGIMPNIVLFDKDVSPTAKLVFVFISSLCAERGYCWANNKYIGKKFGLSESQVSRSIKQLSKYVQIDNPYNERRTIRLRKNAQPPTQKAQGSLRKNAQHNIIKNNINKKGVCGYRYKTPGQMGMPDLSYE